MGSPFGNLSKNKANKMGSNPNSWPPHALNGGSPFWWLLRSKTTRIVSLPVLRESHRVWGMNLGLPFQEKPQGDGFFRAHPMSPSPSNHSSRAKSPARCIHPQRAIRRDPFRFPGVRNDGKLSRSEPLLDDYFRSSLAEWVAQKKFSSFRFATKMVFPKSLKIMNSGSRK